MDNFSFMDFTAQLYWSAEPSPAFLANNGSASSTDSQSEPVAKPDGRLGPVGYAISAQRCGQVEVRTVVNQSPILGANEDSLGDVEVAAPAIHECRSSLCRGAGRIRGREHQAADASLNKWREVPQSMPVDVGRSHLMLVRLHSQRASRQSIGLRVERITVIHFHAMVIREKVTVACQHATAI